MERRFASLLFLIGGQPGIAILSVQMEEGTRILLVDSGGLFQNELDDETPWMGYNPVHPIWNAGTSGGDLL